MRLSVPAATVARRLDVVEFELVVDSSRVRPPVDLESGFVYVDESIDQDLRIEVSDEFPVFPVASRPDDYRFSRGMVVQIDP